MSQLLSVERSTDFLKKSVFLVLTSNTCVQPYCTRVLFRSVQEE